MSGFLYLSTYIKRKFIIIDCLCSEMVMTILFDFIREQKILTAINNAIIIYKIQVKQKLFTSSLTFVGIVFILSSNSISSSQITNESSMKLAKYFPFL